MPPSVIKLITDGKKLVLIFHLRDMAMKAKQSKHTTLYVVQNLDHENLLGQECGLYMDEKLIFCASPKNCHKAL